MYPPRCQRVGLRFVGGRGDAACCRRARGDHQLIADGSGTGEYCRAAAILPTVRTHVQRLYETSGGPIVRLRWRSAAVWSNETEIDVGGRIDRGRVGPH